MRGGRGKTTGDTCKVFAGLGSEGGWGEGGIDASSGRRGGTLFEPHNFARGF